MYQTLKKYYGWSIVVAIAALVIGAIDGFIQGGPTAALSVALTVAILAVLETSLSFDNAVANARILDGWNDKWRHYFINYGIWFAVFGMRIIFPIAIVAVTVGMSPWSVTEMALFAPAEYATKLSSVHHQVAGFGGAFLFMVAFGFFLQEKQVYWWEWAESRLTRAGQIEGVTAALTLVIISIVSRFMPDATHSHEFFVAGVWGVVAFIFAHGIGSLLGGEDDDETSGSGAIIKASVAGFLYLELLDASFSFDGVIGAFVLTNYLPIIALGLGVGAFFVRSMTIHLVEAKTLAEYRYLEHGAFYAIFALAVMMFGSGIGYELPEWMTGLIGASFIGLAFINSLSYNRREAASTASASTPATTTIGVA